MHIDRPGAIKGRPERSRHRLVVHLGRSYTNPESCAIWSAW
jgi:hypothetical protein